MVGILKLFFLLPAFYIYIQLLESYLPNLSFNVLDNITIAWIVISIFSYRIAAKKINKELSLLFDGQTIFLIAVVLNTISINLWVLISLNEGQVSLLSLFLLVFPVLYLFLKMFFPKRKTYFASSIFVVVFMMLFIQRSFNDPPLHFGWVKVKIKAEVRENHSKIDISQYVGDFRISHMENYSEEIRTNLDTYLPETKPANELTLNLGEYFMYVRPIYDDGIRLMDIFGPIEPVFRMTVSAPKQSLDNFLAAPREVYFYCEKTTGEYVKSERTLYVDCLAQKTVGWFRDIPQ